MTRAQKTLLKAIGNGHRFWRYSGEYTGYLILNDGKPESKVFPIRRRTYETLDDLELITEDEKHTFYRDSGRNDIVYKLTEKGQALYQSLIRNRESQII